MRTKVKPSLAQARQESDTISVIANANAYRVRAEREGEAARIRAVGFTDADTTKAIGMAQAEATAKHMEAYGGPQYQLNSTVLLRLAQAIENGKLPLVPQIVVGDGSDGQSGCSNLVEAMLAMMMSEKINDKINEKVSDKGLSRAPAAATEKA